MKQISGYLPVQERQAVMSEMKSLRPFRNADLLQEPEHHAKRRVLYAHVSNLKHVVL